ncbi:hypothetical protein RB653_005997 [Dictyostelium firmibasis]|uniref:Uncharacterized protein n=1 Tax=Dictyostelium firmibasis TaxID=79012 RepID=A0AAN7YYP4_9MYCE
MKFLVYIDDKEPSFSAFYRVLNLVKENDWVIIVAKVKFYRGIGHRSSHVMKHFTRLLDKKHIKNLTFIEYGSIKHIIKNKVKLLKIDMILIASHNSKTKRLCNYCSDNISCNLMIVREFIPLEEYLIPPTGVKADYSQPENLNPIPSNKKKPLMQSESMSSIDAYREDKDELEIPRTRTSAIVESHSMENVSPLIQSTRAGKESIYNVPPQSTIESSDESDDEKDNIINDDDSTEYRLVSTPSSAKEKKATQSLLSQNHPQKSREVV